MERLKRSFAFAVDGIKYSLKHHPNMRIHIWLSLLAILFGILLPISRIEFIIVLVIIVVGLSVELANTAIETTVDLITKEHRLEAKIAKDVSAAMMLIIAVGSLVIALFIYLPAFLRLR